LSLRAVFFPPSRLTEAAGGRVRVSHVLPERRLQISGPTVLGEKVSEGLIGRRDRVGALEPWSPGNLGAPEKSDANHLYFALAATAP
jgi:hypothetical protein